MTDRRLFKNLDGFAPTRFSAGFISICVLLFIASLAATIYFCRMMNGGMHMPGGWTMSMSWMLMPGQSWPGAAASFLGMWIVMMMAMMMPSLVPMLWQYRLIVYRTGTTQLGWLRFVVGIGYFFVWTVFGIAAFSLGIVLTRVEMQQPSLARAVPVAVALVLLSAGALQFTTWKAQYLSCCRETIKDHCRLAANPSTAFRHGLRLGLNCCYCCFGLMVILLVLGVMDLRAMAVVSVAVIAERLAPAGQRIAIITGVVSVGTGLFLLARAAELV